METDDFGEKQVIDLIEDGRNIPVTQENKEEYVQRVVDYRLLRSVNEQLDNFLKGMFYFLRRKRNEKEKGHSANMFSFTRLP